MSYPPPPPPGDPGQNPGGDPHQDPVQYPPQYPPPGGQPPPPYGGGGGYGGGPYGGNPYGGAPQSNSKALWSMVIGIVSVPLACYACLGWIGIAAIIMGNNAKKEIAASGGMQTGEGQAKAGVILGWVGVVLGTLVLVLNIILMATGNTTFNYDFGTTTS